MQREEVLQQISTLHGGGVSCLVTFSDPGLGACLRPCALFLSTLATTFYNSANAAEFNPTGPSTANKIL